MSFLDNWFADLEARTRRERHGIGELTIRDDLPLSATACIMPDGTTVDANCLFAGTATSLDADRVWSRAIDGTVRRRRGRLRIVPGEGLYFLDEPEADAPLAPDDMSVPSLERDLGASARIRSVVRSQLFAGLLYGALCNTDWRHRASGTVWSCGWRSAGAIVASLRAEESYIDWYCWGGEGAVDERVLAEIEALGWALILAA